MSDSEKNEPLSPPATIPIVISSNPLGTGESGIVGVQESGDREPF